MAHSRKAVVKFPELLAQAVLGVLTRQYLRTIKQFRVAEVGSIKNISESITGENIIMKGRIKLKQPLYQLCLICLRWKEW